MQFVAIVGGMRFSIRVAASASQLALIQIHATAVRAAVPAVSVVPECYAPLMAHASKNGNANHHSMAHANFAYT